MAVQAQYPSSVLLLNRSVQEGKNLLGDNNYSLQPHPGGVASGRGGGGGGFLDQSHMIFSNNGEGGNPRKRSREVATITTTTGANMNSFSFSLQNHHHQQQQQRHQQNQNQNQDQNQQLIDLSLLQNQPNVVSTGLRLSFGDQNIQQQHPQQQQQIQQQPTLLSILSDELSLQLKQQSDELNYFLQTQGEQLRRTLAEKRRRHYRAVLGAVEEAVARRIRETEAEVKKAARWNAELEAQWAQLSAEAQSWRARAQAYETQAAILQAQIQHANAMVGGGGGAVALDRDGAGESCAGDDGYVEDTESAYVDPVRERRVNSMNCKVCRKRVASVVLLPCRHLCVCTECNGVVSACPLCLSLRNGSVEVFLT